MTNKISKIDLGDVRQRIIKAIYRTNVGERTFFLKGGSALDLVHQIGLGRSSLDIDMSMTDTLSEDDEISFKKDFLVKLNEIMDEIDLDAFSLTLEHKPDKISIERNSDIPQFWRGYLLKIKFRIKSKFLDNVKKGMARPEKGVTVIYDESGCNNFTIDLSACEYLPEDEIEYIDLGGVFINIYSLKLIAMEKIRAIAQQLECYVPNKKRRRPRPKDFFDITCIYNQLGEDMINKKTYEILSGCMKAKDVPMNFLDLVMSEENKNYHEQAFVSELLETIPKDNRNSIEIKGFQYYFETVKLIIQGLKSFG
jgi:hypothetical protein